MALSESGWQLCDHVCRFCLARLLTRPDGVFRCSTCSAISATEGPQAICGCGMHLGPQPKTSRDRARRRDRVPLGFRCTANPIVSDAAPALFVIAYLEMALPAPGGAP